MEEVISVLKTERYENDIQEGATKSTLNEKVYVLQQT
jgi:hypothetical protein